MSGEEKILTREQLGDIIRKTRVHQKVSQEQLADFTGLSRVGIIRIEKGTSDVKMSTLLNICSMLNLSLSVKYEGD